MNTESSDAHRIQALQQESYYDETVDYRHGSPHLSHLGLHDRLVNLTRKCLADVTAAGLPSRLLEIGAGHGGFTEPVLAAGWHVTAVEASRAPLAQLERRYGGNSCFRAILDQDGSSDLGSEYAVVLIVAVLHHIPDYLSFIASLCKRIVPGGAILTLQDPLWYSRQASRIRALDRIGYCGWRLGQGNIRQAAGTASRRVRGILDDEKPGDMVEYHVVRDGVDELALADLLRKRFADVDIVRYWSHQSRIVQSIGERMGLANTFGLYAKDYNRAFLVDDAD